MMGTGIVANGTALSVVLMCCAASNSSVPSAVLAKAALPASTRKASWEWTGNAARLGPANTTAKRHTASPLPIENPHSYSSIILHCSIPVHGMRGLRRILTWEQSHVQMHNVFPFVIAKNWIYSNSKVILNGIISFEQCLFCHSSWKFIVWRDFGVRELTKWKIM